MGCFRRCFNLVSLMAVQFPDIDFQVSPVERNFYEKHGKRVFDFAASAIGLLVLSPWLLILALLVKLTSTGPVLYRQERVGRGGRIFGSRNSVPCSKMPTSMGHSSHPRKTLVSRRSAASSDA